MTTYHPRPLRLTPRQEEIVALLADGHERRAIADRLGISVTTVCKLLERAFSENGCERRSSTQLVASWAFYEGREGRL